MREKIELVCDQITKVILGKREVIEKVLMAMLALGHVLLEDVPGVGKTTLTIAFAKTMGLDTRRIQFTSDSVPSDVVGFSVLDKRTNEFVYKPGAVMTNLLLADEINRTSSKTQSALLEAMEERNVTVDGQTHSLPVPFIVLATQNPVGSAGTQMLPSSQLDRFMICVSIGYPDFESQVNILKDRSGGNPLDSVKPLMSCRQLMETIAQVEQVHIADEIYRYITALTEATRAHPMVQLGISPRGALALARISRARAYLDGRSYCIPEDVAAMACDVYAHRLLLGAKARFNETSAADLMKDILRQVEMPVLRELR
ncbi:MoxR-like ATPase [Sporobacter termitidis DSM 10068]|uniref:MoxR-like ATPase n=1 Tax=Sporobacter termitidis DSM 10068 TaxID=1123282 RepID=A0A1M5YQ91_9FIRM|nr:MoxR family ATPase [Sporobacter termitidis]SHI14287.1 MoxR-like ATPase [Sporobacter termitidis DSM 10068]